VDRHDNVVVTGASKSTEALSDYYTAKYAGKDGALLWEQRYNGSRVSEGTPTKMAVDGSDNVVVTGHAVVGGFDDFYTAKYAATNGVLLWRSVTAVPAMTMIALIQSRWTTMATWSLRVTAKAIFIRPNMRERAGPFLGKAVPKSESRMGYRLWCRAGWQQ
jgi:hypothetical protein